MAPQRTVSWEANAQVAAACKELQVFHDWAKATELLFRLPTEARVAPDSYAASACLRITGSWASSVQQIAWLQTFPDACDEFTGTAALHSCGASWRHALEILELIQDWRSRLDVVSCSAAINACAKSAQWIWALKFCQEMQAPNEFCFSATVNAFEKDAWPKALETVWRRRTPGSASKRVTHAALLNACGGGLQWSWVMSLFDQVHTQGLDAILFGTSISCNFQRWPMALYLLTSMALHRCDASSVCFGATVNAFESALQWPWAIQLLQQQEDQQIRPNAAAMSATMATCRGDWVLGIFMVQQLEELNAISATSTLRSMDGARGIWPRALKVLKITREADAVTYAATLGLCAQSNTLGAWSHAWHLLELSRRCRVPEDVLSLAPACTSLSSSVSRGKQWRLAVASLSLGAGKADLIALSTVIGAMEHRRGVAPVLAQVAFNAETRLSEVGEAPPSTPIRSKIRPNSGPKNELLPRQEGREG